MAGGGSASCMKTQLVSAIELEELEEAREEKREEEERETAAKPAAEPVQDAMGNYF